MKDGRGAFWKKVSAARSQYEKSAGKGRLESSLHNAGLPVMLDPETKIPLGTDPISLAVKLGNAVDQLWLNGSVEEAWDFYDALPDLP